MASLNFTVKVDLVVGGKVVAPGSIRAPLSEAMDEDFEQGAASSVAGFYVAAWVGGGSPEFSLARVADNGTAELSLAFKPGDPDTLKLAVVTRISTPTTMRCSMLASNFMHRDDAIRSLSEPGRARLGFTADQPCLSMSDNFSRNKALVRFMDKGSDLKAFAKVALKPSSLLRLDEANAAVQRLGEAVEGVVASCAVSPLNAGCQFVQSFTYGHLQGHLMHYATLAEVFRGMAPPPAAQLVAYCAYQAMHSTNLSFDALKSMSDPELVGRYGLPVVTRHTSCAYTNVYCPDLTVGLMGHTCKVRETEDIARSFSRLNYEVQNAGKLRAYAPPAEDPAESTLARCVRDIVASQAQISLKGDAFAASRASPTLDADDCENKALSEQMLAAALRDLYRACKTPQALAAALAREAQRAPRLFSSCTPEHHRQMGEVLCRLGRMLDSGDWSLELAVASAKGPSYREDDPQAAEGLCGHGASVARVRDPATGLYQHYPVEGTTYLTVDLPPPQGFASELPLKLASGEVKTFPLETVATLLAQNVHQLVGLSQHAQVLAHLKQSYGDSPLSCPFYVSTFYTGLSEGRDGSLGCIPLDTCPPSSFRAGTKPLFGAPLLGLSNAATMAVPVTADLLAEPGALPGRGKELVELMRAQVAEAWGPPLPEQAVRDYLSYQQPVRSPDAPRLDSTNYAASVRSENTWAYDDPQVAGKAVQVYQSLAKRFNELQAKDPDSDGAEASAYGQFLSACMGISLPVPKKGRPRPFALSTARNLRKAADDIGLAAALSACVFKSKGIQARAAVVSEHPFYMCHRGEGLVHAFRTKLATS